MKIQKNGKIKFEDGEIEFVKSRSNTENYLDEKYGNDWVGRVKEIYF